MINTDENSAETKQIPICANMSHVLAPAQLKDKKYTGIKVYLSRTASTKSCALSDG